MYTLWHHGNACVYGIRGSSMGIRPNYVRCPFEAIQSASRFVHTTWRFTQIKCVRILLWIGRLRLIGLPPLLYFTPLFCTKLKGRYCVRAKNLPHRSGPGLIRCPSCTHVSQYLFWGNFPLASSSDLDLCWHFLHPASKNQMIWLTTPCE